MLLVKTQCNGKKENQFCFKLSSRVLCQLFHPSYLNFWSSILWTWEFHVHSRLFYRWYLLIQGTGTSWMWGTLGNAIKCCCFLLSYASIGTENEMDTCGEGRWWEGWDRTLPLTKSAYLSHLFCSFMLAPSFCANVLNIHSYIRNY